MWRCLWIADACTVGAGEGAYSGLRYGLEPLLAEHKVDMYFTGELDCDLDSRPR